MIQTTNKNLEIIRKFKKKLGKLGINKLIFFGSRAKGTFNQESDFDIIVTSEKFKGIQWNKRSFEIYKNWNEDYALEVLCYTPEEFNRLKSQITIVKNAVKEGIEIK